MSLDTNGTNGFVGNFNYLRFTLLSGNTPPVVTITNPAVNAVFSAPATLTLKAAASDSDGSVSKVEFFANGTLIATDLSSPFSVPWTNVPASFYTLTARVTDNVGLNTISTPVNISVINGQAPFFGVPQTIPGIIQAEDFDGGGEGVAYHDTDTSNNGSQYRATSVDIENTGDTGGGYNVGWTAGGEWLKYTVNAAVDGIYSIGARAASPNNGTLIHVEIDGQNVTGSMSVTNTGNWQIYQTLTKTNISISAGQHQVQLSEDTGGGNYNYLTFTATSTNPPAVFLQSTAGLTGAFADDNAAAVNTTTKTITIPKSTSTRFYRLHAVVPTRIMNVQIIGTNVVMTYQ